MDTISVLVEMFIILIAHAISGIYSSNLKYSKNVTFIIWGIWLFLQGGIWVFGEFIIKDVGMKFLLVFVSAIVFQYVVFFLTTKGKRSQRLFSILTYSVFFCIFMAFNSAIQGTFPGMHGIVRVIVLISLLAGILYYFLNFVCPLCRDASRIIVKGWYPLIFVDVIFVITLVATSVFPIKLASFYEPEFVSFLFLSISIFSVYPVVFSNIKNMTEVAKKRETEQQNELLLLQIEKENLQISADRMAKHDRRHHNLVLLELANNNDIENLKEYLKNLVDDDTDNFSEISYCKNPTINTVLSVYEKKAKEAGIMVKISVRAGLDIPISPKDIVVVIANLFENAINASKKLKSNEKPIDVDIREKETRLLIKIENPCKNNVKFDETDYGIGISSVIATAEKYEGMYDFAVEGGMFISKVCLNF